jgi:threonine/homoserine/homoserine lactone efflux protein
MPEIATLLIFSTAAFVLTVTPGPDMLLIASRSASQGRIAGLMTFLGIAAGTYCHAFAAALGLAQIIANAPIVFEIVRWMGCAYLLYLAFKSVKAGVAPASAATTCPSRSMSQVFMQGLLTNLLNPKMALFVLALFPQFTVPFHGSMVMQMLLLASLLNVVGFAVNGTVILMAGHAALRSRLGQGSGRLPRFLLASVFTGLALRLATGSRS